MHIKTFITYFVLFMVSVIPVSACEQEELTHLVSHPSSFSEDDPFFNDPSVLAHLDQLEMNALRANSPLRCLSTYEEHLTHLEEAFKKAEKSILITNYGELYKDLAATKLGGIIRNAYHFNMIKAYGPDYQSNPNRRPRVKLYLRYNYKDYNKKESIPLSKKDLDFLDNHFILNIEMIPTHAKILMVDDQSITIGSFNWLTDYTSNYSSYNRSLVCKTGNNNHLHKDAFNGLKTHIWQVLKYYLNKEYANEYGNKHNYKAAYRAKRFSYMNDAQECILKNSSTLTYIPTIEEHRIELLQIFEAVKNRLIIISPFVAFDGANTYQRDFIKPILEDVLKRSVNVYFVSLPDNKERKQYFHSNIRSYLQQLMDKYKNLTLITHNNIHAKSLIKDDDLIAEGSFNWLCAARDETSPDHKHEATLLLEGAEAKFLIEDFYTNSAIGQLLKQRIIHEDKKRKRSYSNDSENKLIKKAKTDIYTLQAEKIDKEAWVNHPFWNPPRTIKYSPERSSLVLNAFFEILSDKSVNKDGYCVKINRNYYLANDNGGTAYFSTIQLAKEAAYEEWLQYYSS